MAITIKHKNVKFRPAPGETAKIIGSKIVSDLAWTNEGGGVYSLNPGYPVHWIYIDGQNTRLSMALSSWIAITDLSVANQVSVNSADLTGVEVVGSYCVSRYRPWGYSRGHKVTNYSSGTLTLERPHGVYDRPWLTSAEAYQSGVDGRLNLFGLASYITNNFDFAIEGGVIYVKLPSAPGNFTIRAVIDSIGIKVKASGFDTNVEMSDFSRSAISAGAFADDLKVSSKIHHVRESPVLLRSGSKRQKVTNGDFHDWGVRGFYVVNPDNAEFIGNHVHAPDTVNKLWLKDAMDQNNFVGAVAAYKDRFQPDVYVKVNDNLIEGTPWCGLYFGQMNGEVLRNRFYDCVTQLSDGGSAYLAMGNRDPAKMYVAEFAYNKIRGVVADNWGAGTRMGIYQDNASGGNEVHHNIIWDFAGNEEHGALYVNKGSAFQKFHHNIVIVKKGNCLQHKFSDFNPGIEARECEIHDNIFIVLDPDFHCLRIEGNIFQGGGFSDNNYFITPYAANRVAHSGQSLAAWQGTYGQDANSRVKENWLTYVNESTAENIHIKLYTNDTGEDVQQLIPAGYEDVDGNDVGGQTLTVPAYYGLVVLKSSN